MSAEVTRLRPVPGWIESHNRGEMSWKELWQKVAAHEFEPREAAKRTHRDKMFEAYGGTDPLGSEDGTVDDVIYGDMHPLLQQALLDAATIPDQEKEWLANPPGLFGVEE